MIDAKVLYSGNEDVTMLARVYKFNGGNPIDIGSVNGPEMHPWISRYIGQNTLEIIVKAEGYNDLVQREEFINTYIEKHFNYYAVFFVRCLFWWR